MPLPLMEYTILKFPSMQKLWEFQKLANLKEYHFHTRDCTLRAIVTEEQVWLALKKMQAQVRDRQETM